jgi:hypothetical protein
VCVCLGAPTHAVQSGMSLCEDQEKEGGLTAISADVLLDTPIMQWIRTLPPLARTLRMNAVVSGNMFLRFELARSGIFLSLYLNDCSSLTFWMGSPKSIKSLA